MDTSGDRLVEQAAGGDRLAMGRLLMLYDAPLRRRIASRITADLQGALSAEDVLQETYIEAYRHMGTFTPRGQKAFYGWLAAVADHKLIDAVKALRAAKRPPRHRAQRVPTDLSTSLVALAELADGKVDTPSGVVSRKEAVQAVQTALAALPEACRKAVWLRHIKGKPVRDIAAAMGRTERAVHQLCYRGLALLRQEMGSRSRFLSGGG